jgi:hypothetical protein
MSYPLESIKEWLEAMAPEQGDPSVFAATEWWA